MSAQTTSIDWEAVGPDLLEALQKCRAHIAREDDADDMAECLEAAEDAIAKATAA